MTLPYAQAQAINADNIDAGILLDAPLEYMIAAPFKTRFRWFRSGDSKYGFLWTTQPLDNARWAPYRWASEVFRITSRNALTSGVEKDRFIIARFLHPTRTEAKAQCLEWVKEYDSGELEPVQLGRASGFL